MFGLELTLRRNEDIVSGAKAGVREGSQGSDVAGASASREEDTHELVLRSHSRSR